MTPILDTIDGDRLDLQAINEGCRYFLPGPW